MPHFARHVHDQAVSKVGPDGLRPLYRLPQLSANPVFARLSPEQEFLGTCAYGHPVTFEASAQMRAANLFTQQSKPAGLPAGVERDHFGIVDGESSEQMGHLGGAGVTHQLRGRARGIRSVPAS